MTSPPPLIEGWLNKRGVKGFLKKFKKRYFLQNGPKLEYAAQQGSKILGFIDIEKVTNVKKYPEDNFFELVTKDRTFLLQALPDEDGKDAGKWTDDLTKWINYYRKLSNQSGSFAIQKTNSMSQINISNNYTNTETSTSNNILSTSMGSKQMNIETDGEIVIEKIQPISNDNHDSGSLPEINGNRRSWRVTKDQQDVKSTLRQKTEECALKDAMITDLQSKLDMALHQLGKLDQGIPGYLRKSHDRFWRTIKENDVEGLQKILLQEKDMDLKKESINISIVHFAVLWGSVNVLEYLLEQGCRIDVTDELGQTPLLYAIERLSGDDSYEISLLLIRAGADVNKGDTSDNLFTPLHAACLAGHYSIVRLLIQNGADLERTDGRLNWTCLHWAVSGGNIKVIELLLEKGATITKVNGVSPLDIAQDDNNNVVYNFLKEHKSSKIK